MHACSGSSFSLVDGRSKQATLEAIYTEKIDALM
jgi:hypothetical protein